MGRALAELKKRLNHRWLQENRPDLDNQKDSRQESLEQDRIQEKYAADEEYIEARELGCPICSHALTTVSASAECPMCEVLWHYHQDDGFSYFEAEVEEFGEEEYLSEERGCYDCPECGVDMWERNSPIFGEYCYCIDCKEHYITKPMAMMAAESDEMTVDDMNQMVKNLGNVAYNEFCYRFDIDPEDAQEMSWFIADHYDAPKVISWLMENQDNFDDFEAVAVYQGKKPEGSVAKALLQKKLMDKAELLDTIHKLENDVRLGLISEEEIMKQLKEKFGAENQDNFNAEFCSECGCSHKDAEEFAAETSGGNQVFNSCWKCGSGQHLYQIARYPATASEIAGVGGNPEEVSEGGKQRAGN